SSDVHQPPNDTESREYPYLLNAYIAGYWGYLELERLARQPESTSVRNTLNQMLQFRADNFSKDTPFSPLDGVGDQYDAHKNRLNISRNFIYLTPELAQYLRQHCSDEVQEAIHEYNCVAPYWFVSRYEGCQQECTIQNLHDYYALFQAKAWILQDPREELVRYLDVPGFMRGDLFYIHNLISAIEAQPAGPVPPTATPSATHTPTMTPVATNTPAATMIPTNTPTASATPTDSGPGPASSDITTNLADYPNGQVPRYDKLELTFQVDTVAQNLQLPYDAAPPPGVDPEIGVTVDALFTPDDWQTVYTQPAFYYQEFEDQVRSSQEWFYPTNNFSWRVRFAPDQVGTWQF
ncbi:MAG: hypothetical protein FJY85_24755, partial [Deltaproteobacteria bacterium]|nr:hypothetical protein [Deltaproteobacteria bacterium]